jgi:hypothetical protein
MAKLETALSLEQILEGMRQLSDEEKRALASIVLSDPRFEAFVEESRFVFYFQTCLTEAVFISSTVMDDL